MGVLKLWPFIKEQGYIAPLKAFPTIPPANTVYHLDILGSFFSVIRRCFLHSDTSIACAKFEEHLISCLFPKSTTTLHIDGPSPAEKNATNETRQSKRDKASTKGNKLLTDMEETLHNQGRLRKQQFKTVNKAIVDSFYFTHELRQALAKHLRASGWIVCECLAEADTCIGANCNKDDIVITRDSDALLYSNINTIWRPFGRDQYLVYHVSDLLRQLELSRAGLTTLGIVTQNDYGTGVHKMGLKGNFKVIRALEQEDAPKPASVQELVDAYLENTTVSSKHPTEGLFDSALRIFTLQQSTPLTLPHIQDPINDLREMTQRLADIRLHLKISRKRSRSAPGGQEGERTTNFIRYSTVDHPPNQLPPPHKSGRQYKHRERYAVKTRSRLISHDKPDIFKQYIWKPPKDNTESDNNPNSTTSTSTEAGPNTKAGPSTETGPSTEAGPSTNVSTTSPPPKKKRKSTPKKVRSAADMTKFQLVKAMQWEHPLRTLDIGTLKANTSRALKKEVPHDADSQQKLQQAITTSLSDISNLASRTKRGCQQAIGQYLENIAIDHLDRDDRMILSYLTPPFSVQEIEEAKKGTNPKPDEVSPDNKNNPEASMDDKNSPESFFLSLMVAIYHTSAPRKRDADSAMALRQFLQKSQGDNPQEKMSAAMTVDLFLQKAKDYLPPKTGSETYNNPSVFLQSTAIQLATEYKKHFKNGSLNLCQKIQQQKKKGLLPESAPDQVNPDKTPAENFIILNRTLGRSWRLSPMSPRGRKFVSLSEDDLVRVFWTDVTLRKQLQSYAHPTLSSFTDASRIPQTDVVGWLKNIAPGELINRLLTDIGGFTEDERRKKKHWSRSAHRMSIDDMTAHISSIRDKDFNPVVSYSSKGYALRGTMKTDGYRIQLLAFKLNELNCVKYRRLDEDKLPDPLTSTLGGTGHYLKEIRNVVKTPEDVRRIWDCDPKDIKILGIDLGQAFVVGASALLPSPTTATPPDGEEQGPIAEIDLPLPTQFHTCQSAKRPSTSQLSSTDDGSNRGRSTQSKETNLPPLRGPEASIIEYVKQSSVVESDLETFYNNVTLKKHQWDAKRARDQEFELVGKRLLELVGVCQEFVGQVDIRQLYCPTCAAKMHRDVMAGHNMCKAIQGHLLHHKRPHYLQPYDKNGNYIWEMEENSQFAESTLAPLAVKDVEATGPGGRKREAN
ncbi:MAG: hypothetical protein J3R72DRAFT_502378 [Linnemannia gamsii]|nr:MAG: hypothetical protein J3R72DRAFT_502378 [Linnemannia gamsii]